MKKIAWAFLELGMLFVSVPLFVTCKKGDESGAKQQTKSGSITIVFVPKITRNAFFETSNDRVQNHSKEWGFTVKYNGSPDASVANQVTIINNAIQQGMDGIAVSSLDSTELDTVMKQAEAKGLAVVTWDSDVSGMPGQ